MPTTRNCASSVLPAYRRLHDYLAQEYLPVARTTVGWAALPGGDYWYAYLVRYYTGSAMTPLEAQEFGTTEVTRLRGEVERLKGAIGLTGSLARSGRGIADEPGLSSCERPSAGARRVRARAGASLRPRLPGLFARPLTTGLEIRAVEPYRAAGLRPPCRIGPQRSKTNVRACST